MIFSYKLQHDTSSTKLVKDFAYLRSHENYDQHEMGENISEIKKACFMFFESEPNEAIESLKIVVQVIKETRNIDLKKHILSLDLIPRSLSISKSVSVDQVLTILELVDVVLENNPALKSPEILNFCFNFFTFLIENHIWEENIQSLHFLIRSFINLICLENVHMFNGIFFDNLIRFQNYAETIDIDISLLVERLSLYIPVDYEHRYFFNYMKDLIRGNHEKVSINLVSALRNIVKRNNSFINNTTSWPFHSIIQHSTSVSAETQKVTFEICTYLISDVVAAVMTNKNVYISVLNVIQANDLTDIRLIPVIHSLTHFLRLRPLQCAQKYLASREASDRLTPCLIQIILEGPFELKVDTGYLLSFEMKQNPDILLIGFFPNLCDLYQIKTIGLRDAILILLEIDDVSLISNIIGGLEVICQECTKKGLLEELKCVFAESRILENIQGYRYHESNEISEAAELLLNYLIE